MVGIAYPDIECAVRPVITIVRSTDDSSIQNDNPYNPDDSIDVAWLLKALANAQLVDHYIKPSDVLGAFTSLVNSNDFSIIRGHPKSTVYLECEFVDRGRGRSRFNIDDFIDEE
jgi:hypothetical protein